MTHRFLSVATVGAAALALLALAATGGAIADEPSNETINETAENVTDELANATASPTSMPNATETPEPAGVTNVSVDDALRIDSAVILSEWEYRAGAGEFVLHFEVEEVTGITITEAVQFKEGGGSGSLVQERLLPGDQTVVVPVMERAGEAALTFTTAETMENEQFRYISTGQADTDSPFEGTSATGGWIGGATTVAGVFVLVALQAARRDPTAPEEIEP